MILITYYYPFLIERCEINLIVTWKAAKSSNWQRIKSELRKTCFFSNILRLGFCWEERNAMESDHWRCKYGQKRSFIDGERPNLFEFVTDFASKKLIANQSFISYFIICSTVPFASVKRNGFLTLFLRVEKFCFKPFFRRYVDWTISNQSFYCFAGLTICSIFAWSDFVHMRNGRSIFMLCLLNQLWIKAQMRACVSVCTGSVFN